MMRSKPIYMALLTMVAVVAFGCNRGDAPNVASTEAALTGPPPMATGLELYVMYCQSCHGATGLGDGPVAPLLKVATPDLTRLVQKYGEFPEELVAATMDGRAEVENHGTRQMPVWGNVWDVPDDSLSEQRVMGEIQKVVAFIQSVQASN